MRAGIFKLAAAALAVGGALLVAPPARPADMAATSEASDDTAVAVEAAKLAAGPAVKPAAEVAAAAPVVTVSQGEDCGFKSIYLTESLTGAATGDLVAIRQNGELWRYPGKTGGGFDAGQNIGQGWQNMTSLVLPGDMNQDGKADLLAINAAGELLLYAGNGWTGLARSVKIGQGWQNLQVTAVGDMNGNGLPDLFATTPEGQLFSYLSNGRGEVRSNGQIGQGWQGYELISGAAHGNKPGQIFARDANGDLYWWTSNGRGGVSTRTKVGFGWAYFKQVLGGADLTGNGQADLLGWTADGQLRLYQGMGGGRLQAGRLVGHGFVEHTTYCPASAPVPKPPAPPPPKPAAKHVVKYQVALRGVPSSELESFATRAQEVFDDPNGWARSGIAFRRVNSGGSFTLWLSEDRSVPSFSGACSTFYSCQAGSNVVINYDRWRYGAAPKVPIADYQMMVINHEVGHWLGLGHKFCPGAGKPAPLMMQQSKGLGSCTFNPRPLPSELRTPRFG
ncbi:MAG: DUF3152 domain-containing protein [Micrococcales bacterium]|nr:DUF3152 domain-containing protein [Micrococcales bacterium]